MSVRDDFLAMPTRNASWSANEYQVKEVHDTKTSGRVWVGTSAQGSLTAFFESRQSAEIDVDLSHVIRITAAKVSNKSGERAHAVQVQCLEPKLNNVFVSYVDDVLSHLVDGMDAVRALSSTVAEWRTLLAVAKDELSESALRGLFGELSFLRDLVTHNGPGGLSVWAGADRERHDFVATMASVEIKTSTLQNRQAVTVHGLRQLEPAHGSDLTLGVAEIDRHPEGKNVSEVVDELLDLKVDSPALRTKLANSGFVQGMPGADRHRFHLVSWKFWEVTSELPVLRRTALDEAVVNAVSDLRYSLDLGVLGPDFADSYDFYRLTLDAA